MIRYDVTTYLAEHPGGDDILVEHGGRDATERFRKANHSDYAVSLRDMRLVGSIESGPKPSDYLDRLL
jgi:cytochrome b involved in lipid metabolism